MAGYRRDLPSITALVSFEAAARLLSFTQAAGELGVTQAAVSHQIRSLEEGLGFPLFYRLHRQLELSEQGQVLSAVMSRSLAAMAETVRNLMEQTPDDLTVSATLAVSHFWLLPRLADFRRSHPATRIRIVAQDNYASLAHRKVDVGIRYGDGNWSDGRAQILFDDEVFPVCSPDYAAAHGAPATVSEMLTQHALITYDGGENRWVSWAEWLAACGETKTGANMAVRCSHYMDAVYTALGGQGIVLAWRRLLTDFLADGRLVPVTGTSMRTRNAYFVVLPVERRPAPGAEAFVAWLRARAQEEEHRDAGMIPLLPG